MNGNFFRILKYFKPFMHLLFISILLAIFINGAELAGPYIMKITIDDFIIGRSTKWSVEVLGGIYLAAVAVGGICSYLQVHLLNYVGQRTIHSMRMQLFSHIQNMPLSFFDSNSSGRMLTRVTNDIEALNEMYSGVLVALFKDIFMLIGIVVVMLRLNLRLALIGFTMVPVLMLITYLYKRKAMSNFKRIRHLISRINGFLAENISGMKLVQIFNREKEKYGEFEEVNNEYNRASKIEVVLMAIFKPGSELINSMAICVLVWYCIPGVIKSTLEIGVLYAFVNYIQKFFDPIKDLADKYNTIVSARVSAGRIFELMDNCQGLEELGRGSSLSEIKGEIEFRNVWFSYNNKDWILKDVSFKINAGETAAFVGATGSGKSTIINLIGRFYEVQQGEILLDGVNIKEIKLKDLRRTIAVVMQDVFLFSGDIKSNIRLNDSRISDEDVIEASKYVDAHSFIESLPDKYDEQVKERGCNFSSGQRQLLSFARAVVFKPAILVLDEATANIDTETERIIQDSLQRISEDRTTLVIAHRLSTIKEADRIIVIHKGRVKEMGRHEELIQKQGIYKNLYDMQAM